MENPYLIKEFFMGKTIFITEKPSVAQEYVKVLKVKKTGKTDGYVEGYSPVLNKDVQITWAVGHLINLASVPEQKAGRLLNAAAKKEYHWGFDNLPALFDNYIYQVSYATKDQFNVIKSLYTAKDVDAIYYAGDSGREGIYIQALIRNQIFKGADPRGIDERVVWIDSQTEEAILNGIRDAKPYHSYDNLIASGYARAIDDFSIGMNFTEGLTVKAKNKVIAGRVMSPTLAMVVNRQKEIDDFVVTDYYGINANPEGYTFTPKWKAVPGSAMYDSALLYNETGFKKEEDAKAFCKNNLKFVDTSIGLTVDGIKVTEKKEIAPYLFNLAELQAHCSRQYHISPDDTLKIAQSLYEKKMTTYPRTDARVLSSAVAKELEKKFGKPVPKKYVDDSKITDHYAIIPTFENHLNQCKDLEKAVFNDIMLRFKSIFKPPYVYDSINITLKSESGEVFTTTEKQEKQLGWKELYTDKPDLQTINIPSKGDVLQCMLELNPCQTKPPAAYTTGTLILTMEKAGKFIEDEELREQIKGCGIGTSATRAGIISKLIDKGYIAVDKKQKVSPTETGKQVIEVLNTIDKTIISPEKTAEMEQSLSDIANGTLSPKDHRKAMNDYITEKIQAIKDAEGISVSKAYGSKAKGSKSGPAKQFDCPCCSTPLKYGKFGYYCENKDFSGSRGGYILTEKDMERLLSKGETTYKNMTSKTGNKFKAKFVLKDIVGSEKKELGLEFEK